MRQESGLQKVVSLFLAILASLPIMANAWPIAGPGRQGRKLIVASAKPGTASWQGQFRILQQATAI